MMITGIIFLDIDGVLNDHAINAAAVCGIKPSCVDAFNSILEAVPGAQVVLSSAWRYMILGGDITTKGFSYLLMTHGVNIGERLIGHTCSDESENLRGKQVRRFLDDFKGIRALVIDDMELGFEGLTHLKTDPGVGLTPKDAQAAVSFLLMGQAGVRSI